MLVICGWDTTLVGTPFFLHLSELFVQLAREYLSGIRIPSCHTSNEKQMKSGVKLVFRILFNCVQSEDRSHVSGVEWNSEGRIT